LTADRRTLVLRVPRQTEAVSYAITLPTPASWRTAATGPGVIEQMPEMDLAVTLDGVRASLWPGLGSNPNAGAPSGLPVAESIWPHPSPAVTRALTRGSAEHEHFFQAWAAAGDGPVVRLRGQIDRSNLFVPAVQPGATLDWDPSKDDFARQSMTVHEGAGSAGPGGAGAPVTLTGTDPVAGYDVAIRGPLTEASAAAAGLTLALGDRVRPVPLNRLALPWARRGASPPSAPGGAEVARSDVRGRWLEGRRVFFGDGGCATCHALRGEGTAFGPDLSNLIHRDRDSVLKDITRPSATINPDVTGSTVVFRDGTEVNGVVATLDERRIVVRQPAGVQTERPRSDVASIRPMTGSLMPENLEQVLTPAQMEDLLTFLLVNPLEPTRITRTEPEMPPARTRTELEGLLPSPGAPAAAPGSRAPLRILLCIDDKDHGIDEHDYPLWQERWAKLLALGDGVTVTTARVFPSRAQLAAADVMVFYSRNSGWGKDKAALLDEFQGRGGGLVLIHWAMEGRQEALAYGERVGLATGPGSRYRHGAMELNFVRRDHPITRGFTRLPLIDETYWVFHGDPSRVTPLAEAVEENAPRVQLWTHERGKGRVFGSIPGHYMWTFDDPLYRVLLLRGIAWAARQDDVDRLLDLATIGARVAP
jgi:putative heme-binding domain-containing protein